MVTRSIVGRFLILAVLLVSLGVIAQAAIYISSGKKVAKADPPPTVKAPPSAIAALAPAPAAAGSPVVPAAAGSADAAPVRVVYPGPLGDAPAPRKIADAAPASPLPNPAAAPPVTGGPVAAAPAAPAVVAAAPVVAAPAAPPPAAPAPPPVAKPAPVVIASADPATGTPAAVDPAPAARGGVNLNNASVEALNHLGGGHIGQTIVKHRPYASVEDLVKKRVVRRSVYEQIKDQVAAE